MHPNAQLIERFYTAFSNRDAAGMAACYYPEVAFDDPAFPGLKGWEAAAMWTMLCERGKDLKVVFSGIEAGALDVLFVSASDPFAAKLAANGLKLELPEPPKEDYAPKAPGMDPDSPPILK